MLRRVFIASSALVIVALSAAPAGANDETITMRVPVKLKKMLPQASGVRVYCRVMAEGRVVGSGAAQQPISNGQFDGVVEVIVRSGPAPKGAIIGADSYWCYFQLPASGWSTPRQGTPPDAQPWMLGRPDEFFRTEVKHAIGPGKAVDGIAGPGGLTAPPKQKQ